MGVFITGCAGFIGYHVAKRCLDEGREVVGIDNLNDYYDVQLKLSRLNQLKAYSYFHFIEGDIADISALDSALSQCKPNCIIVHLAAQAGVRYSIDSPEAYIESNLVGFFNVLEACRRFIPSHFVYASSSSVYGNQQKTPFAVGDPVDKPISLYAATKLSNELLAYSYAHLFHFPATGLRFFTVYGPYGRPDMAYFKFVEKIIHAKPITIYNDGNMYRDFTYVDDIVEGIRLIMLSPPRADENNTRHAVYNIGNSKPESLLHFVEVIEDKLGIKAKKTFLPMQKGDVYQTFADITAFSKDFGYQPNTNIHDGIGKFVDWYRQYYRQ